MSRQIDPMKDWDQLDEDEQRYLNQRAHLKAEFFRIRKHVEAQHDSTGGEEVLVGGEDEGSENELTPEQWVEQANKEQVISELENRGIEHDPKARKDVLAKLLLEHVNNED